MAVAFHAPSHRHGSSDLTIQISPLGLVELADEEFEVHGPRLNRYATNWAFYLGHHWSQRREQGEKHITVNYARRFADYLTNFTFGKGISVELPKENEAVVTPLLSRVWNVDNAMLPLLWEIGSNGSVSGDSFVKVAYEDPWVDPAGIRHPGRVRIIPLNSSYVFPEYHPHDRSRMIRVKIKYRFWGTSLEGTRQVFTFTELLTDNAIEEYINDELVDSRPNPLGEIPVIQATNFAVSGSPWGLSDLHDMVGLNQTYNEVMTDVQDIVNYHAAPVTVITGARASQLEKGARKIWSLPSEAKIQNLEMGGNLASPLAFLAQIKQQMHEMTGVTEAALGQTQPVSNTSGVAMQIMYLPTMGVHENKTPRYGFALERVNALALKLLFLYEPESQVYNIFRSQGVELKPGQLPQLDPTIGESYVNSVKWPSPMPFDVMIKLQELATKMEMGLLSKKGALRELGEGNPDLVLNEVFEESMEDSLDSGARILRDMENQMAATMLTGMVAPEDGDGEVGPAQPASPIADQVLQATAQALLERAHGTKLPVATPVSQ